MIIIGFVILMTILTILIPVVFDGDSKKDANASSQNKSLTNAECSSSINCPQVFIESYCQNDSVYKKLHDYSCIDGKCVEKIKEPELFETCSSKYECKNGICEPISVPINSCGFYLNTKGGYFKLERDITGNNLTEHCITIMKDNVTFDCDGHSIRSDSAYSGVYSEDNKYITIKNCDISMSLSGGTGISLYNNIHSRVLDNKLNNQNIGLHLNWETNAIINGNTMKSNNKTGIFIEKNSNSEISDNTACDNNEKDLKIIGSSNIQGVNNEFGVVDLTSDGWPVLDKNYDNCIS